MNYPSIKGFPPPLQPDCSSPWELETSPKTSLVLFSRAAVRASRTSLGLLLGGPVLDRWKETRGPIEDFGTFNSQPGTGIVKDASEGHWGEKKQEQKINKRPALEKRAVNNQQR